MFYEYYNELIKLSVYQANKLLCKIRNLRFGINF